jgi:hypothetical protein
MKEDPRMSWLSNQFDDIGQGLSDFTGVGTTSTERELRRGREAQERAAAEAKAEAEKWAGEYGNWREDFSHVGDMDNADGTRTRTGKRYDDLSGQYTAEVDRGMYDAGTQVAAGMARRGMTDSGYAAGMQSDVIGNAAAARASAREAAMKEAIGEGMNFSFGDLSGLGMQSGTAQAPYLAARGFAEDQLSQNQQSAAAAKAARDKAQMQLIMLAALA